MGTSNQLRERVQSKFMKCEDNGGVGGSLDKANENETIFDE